MAPSQYALRSTTAMTGTRNCAATTNIRLTWRT
jgi:hypothetical protein